MKTTNVCFTCQKPKAPYQCALCECSSCKSCAHFLNENHFAFLKSVPPELSHTVYCANCYAEKVAPVQELYDQQIEQAKVVNVFYKNQGKVTRFMKRKEDPFKVENCIDKDEALLRLCFMAVQGNFNSIIDTDIVSEKTMKGTYKHTSWSGSAVPINLTEKTMVHSGSSY